MPPEVTPQPPMMPPAETSPGITRSIQPTAGRAYSLYVLCFLTLVYVTNFIDRIVLGILVAPIKSEIHLTDSQLGFLGGTAFALFYTALGIPVGWWADRANRVRIMTRPSSAGACPRHSPDWLIVS